MSLCCTCCRVSTESITGRLPLDVRFGNVRIVSGHGPDAVGMAHLSRGSELVESAKTCGLCGIFQIALSTDLAQKLGYDGERALENDQNRHNLSLTSDPIFLTPRYDPQGRTFPDPLTEGLYLTGFVVHAVGRVEDGDMQLAGNVRLYAERDDEYKGRCDVLGRPTLRSPSRAEAFKLINRWIHGCLEMHPECRETISGFQLDESIPPELPARVIDVGLRNDSSDRTAADIVRIIETQGLRSRYIALSHCWGPPSKRPTMTTSNNLSSHMNGLPLSSLPRCFQDAVKVCRNLGICYLWIDSLCILQDNREDWLLHSSQMGRVYEHATLTIAASHTPDTYSPMLWNRGDLLPIVQVLDFLPYTKSQSPQKIKIFATPKFDDIPSTFPEYGALVKRAWATQEWLLSRRMVFYAATQMIWSCKIITQRETGEKCFNHARNPRWKTIVELYSERLLSVSSDKLIALEGLRTEMGKKTGDTYVWGLWKESFPEQLLWQVARRVDKEFVDGEGNEKLDVPSWSWAKIPLPTGVKFLLLEGAKSLCDSIEVVEGEGRILSIKARLKKLGSFKPSLNETKGGDEEVLKRMSEDIRLSNAKTMKELVFYLVDVSQRAIGWVVLDFWADGEEVPSPLHCFAIMGSKSRRDEEREERLGYVSKKLPEYWILLLRESRMECDTYARIGAGKMYGQEWWKGVKPQEVRVG